MESTKFSLFYHSPTESSYEEDTFKVLFTLNNEEEILAANKALLDKEAELLSGNFYLMKNDIKPIWNNDIHINGGTIGWKIDKVDSIKSWQNLFILFLSNSLDSLNEKYNITGISINPKKNCNILKIWFGSDIPDEAIDNLELPKECIFSHKIKLYKRFASFYE